MEKEKAGQTAERDQERERLNNQIKVLNQKISQMQRLFEKQLGAKPSTSSRAPDKSPMEPPTANIKPMAGSSSSPRKEKQTTVSLFDFALMTFYISCRQGSLLLIKKFGSLIIILIFL